MAVVAVPRLVVVVVAVPRLVVVVVVLAPVVVPVPVLVAVVAVVAVPVLVLVAVAVVPALALVVTVVVAVVVPLLEVLVVVLLLDVVVEDAPAGAVMSLLVALLPASSVDAVPVVSELVDRAVTDEDVVDTVDVPDAEEVDVPDDDVLVLDEAEELPELLEPGEVVVAGSVPPPSAKLLSSADVAADDVAGASSARTGSSVPTAIPA